MFRKIFSEFLQNITGQCIKSIENDEINKPTLLQSILNAREKFKQNGKGIDRI